MISTQTVVTIANLVQLIAQAVQISGAAPAVPKVLDIFAKVLMHSAPALDELVKLRELVKTMVNETREPTDDEWNALSIRSDIAHEAIQSVDLTGPIATELKQLQERDSG